MSGVPSNKSRYLSGREMPNAPKFIIEKDLSEETKADIEVALAEYVVKNDIKPGTKEWKGIKLKSLLLTLMNVNKRWIYVKLEHLHTGDYKGAFRMSQHLSFVKK